MRYAGRVDRGETCAIICVVDACPKYAIKKIALKLKPDMGRGYAQNI